MGADVAQVRPGALALLLAASPLFPMDKAAPAEPKAKVMSAPAGYRNVTGSPLTLTLPPCWENAVGDVRVTLDVDAKSTVYLSVHEQETFLLPAGALAWFEVEGPQDQPMTSRILNVDFDAYVIGFLAIRFKAVTGSTPSATFFPTKPRKRGDPANPARDRPKRSLTGIIN